MWLISFQDIKGAFRPSPTWGPNDGSRKKKTLALEVNGNDLGKPDSVYYVTSAL